MPEKSPVKGGAHSSPGKKAGVASQDHIKLTKPSCRIGISWDNLSGCAVDLDLQGVIVDSKGHIVDAVYHNNLRALNGAIAHSGDDEDGEGDGFDEFIQVRTTKLPEQCHLIIFIVAASNGSLKDADNGKVGVEEGANNTVKEMKIERSSADCDVVAYMVRRDKAWYLQVVETPALCGSHFLDILEPNIGDIIRFEIPGAPMVQRVAFVMEKGAVTDFPQGKDLRRLLIGVGGALKRDAKEAVDIDVSAVLYKADGHRVAIVDGKTGSRVKGVVHSGDGMAGARSGDDEALSIDLELIDQKITKIYIVMSIKDGTFELVQSAYARVTDQAMVELAGFNIDCGNRSSQLIVATLLRQPGGRWGCTAVGHFCDTQKECTEALARLAKDLPIDPSQQESKKEVQQDGTATFGSAKSVRKQKGSRTACVTVTQSKEDNLSQGNYSSGASPLLSRLSMQSAASVKSGGAGKGSFALMPSTSMMSGTGYNSVQGTKAESAMSDGDCLDDQKPGIGKSSSSVKWDAALNDVRYIDDDAEAGNSTGCGRQCCSKNASGGSSWLCAASPACS
mmetsp:Transcript_36129/g.84660  ORF Transcript_36129/g.84660 Transcript_36129/m.84660 type:complete len:563 (-) Transcript_36129:90-1778(-)